MKEKEKNGENGNSISNALNAFKILSIFSFTIPEKYKYHTCLHSEEYAHS